MLGVPHGIDRGKTKVNIYVDIMDKTLQGTVTGTVHDRISKTNYTPKCTSSFDQKNLPPHYVFVGKGICLMDRSDLFQTKACEHNSSEEKPNLQETTKNKNATIHYKTVVNGVAVKMVNCIFDCPSFNEDYLQPLYMLQNLPSLIAGHALMSGVQNSPKQSELILDMCAAPGGKTTHIASILSRRGNGKIIALDKSQKKVDNIVKNCRLFGVEHLVQAYVRDSTRLLSANTSVTENSQENEIFKENLFDRILLDAPCSALGQRPQFRVSMKPKELASFPKIQRKLFAVAYKLLKPGGVLVYSTCTFTIEENEGMIQWAMNTFSEDLIVDGLFSNDTSMDSETHSKIEHLSNLGMPGIDVNKSEPQQKYLNLSRRFGIPFDNIYERNDANSDTIAFFVVKFKKIVK